MVLVRLGGLFFAPCFSWGVKEAFSTSPPRRSFSHWLRAYPKNPVFRNVILRFAQYLAVWRCFTPFSMTILGYALKAQIAMAKATGG